MADISKIQLPSGTTYDIKDKTSGFITSSDIPVTSVNTKTGAITLTASDVGALPDSTDVTKWNGVSLAKQQVTYSGDTAYVPATNSLSPNVISFTKYTYIPTANVIAKYDTDSYLYSTTPASSDNSTKVATTTFVQTALADIDALPDQTGQSGKFLTTDGTDASWATVSSGGDQTYQGEITASTDLTTLTAGVWGVTNIINADFPDSTVSFFGYLIQYNDTYKNQLLVAGVAGESDIYHRRYLIGSSAFTAWEKVTNISDLTNYMVKGVDYVTAGKKSGMTLGNKATAEGYNTTASGQYSHAEGSNTTASGNNSHAEGDGTQASNDGAHAEGEGTIASGINSHAEGEGSIASGRTSHAEGYTAGATGDYSHAEGSNTIAQRRNQHVFGRYNILDTTGSGVTVDGAYVEIVGNGTASNARSNARTLDWSGNETLAGSITIGNSATMVYNSTDKSIDFVFN